LTDLLISAELLENDGFDSFNFTGNRKQSLLQALRYYGYYFGQFTKDSKSYVPATRDHYPSYRQYIGKQVSYDKGTTVTLADDTLIPFVVAYRHYPRDPIIRQVLSRAASFNRNCVPFSGIDSFHIDRLVDISECRPIRQKMWDVKTIAIIKPLVVRCRSSRKISLYLRAAA
jgi:hypothetical protein